MYISSVAYIATVDIQLLKELNKDYVYGPFDKNESTNQCQLKKDTTLSTIKLLVQRNDTHLV